MRKCGEYLLCNHSFLHIYYFEDSDWLFYKGSFDVPEVDKWTLEQWKRWFCSGTVIIYSRDTYDRYGDNTLDTEWYIQNKNVQESYKKECGDSRDGVSPQFRIYGFLERPFLIGRTNFPVQQVIWLHCESRLRRQQMQKEYLMGSL